jgi:hypothetical protein
MPTQHPNAVAAGLSGSVTVLAVYLAGLAGLDIPAEVASAFTTIVAGVVLLAGHRTKRASRHR